MPAISTKLLSLICMGNQSVVWLRCWLMKTKRSSHPDGSHHMLHPIFPFQLSDIFITTSKLVHTLSFSLSLLFPLPFLFLWVWPPCGPVWCGSCAHCWPWSCSARTGARSAGPAADCAASGTACAAPAQSHTWRSLWAAGCVGGCTEFGTGGT